MVLLDVMMPGQDGPQTLERLRVLPAGRELPVIFLTAKAMRAQVERLQTLGVEGVIAKPFDPMALAGEVSKVLGWATL
ncbi:MAG: response regulator [Egicoccus sp.]